MARIRHSRQLEILEELVAVGYGVVLLLVSDIVFDIEPRSLGEHGLLDLGDGHFDGLL